MIYYILKDKKAVPTKDLLEWVKMFEDTKSRIVKQEECKAHRISTVFLGIDHNWVGTDPLLFETMVFDKNGNEVYCDRCSTWDEAELMHEKAVKEFNLGLLTDNSQYETSHAEARPVTSERSCEELRRIVDGKEIQKIVDEVGTLLEKNAYNLLPLACALHEIYLAIKEDLRSQGIELNHTNRDVN